MAGKWIATLTKRSEGQWHKRVQLVSYEMKPTFPTPMWWKWCHYLLGNPNPRGKGFPLTACHRNVISLFSGFNGAPWLQSNMLIFFGISLYFIFIRKQCALSFTNSCYTLNRKPILIGFVDLSTVAALITLRGKFPTTAMPISLI